MNGIYLVDYRVRGVKSLNEWAELSFFKKTIDKNFSPNGYNVKGIYGANGAGKSGLISSVKILSSILSRYFYLGNDLVQKHLNDLINKKLEAADYCVQFLGDNPGKKILYQYQLSIGKDSSNRYCLKSESLGMRISTSHKTDFKEVFTVENGSIISLGNESVSESQVVKQTVNLLRDSSLTAAFFKTIDQQKEVSSQDRILAQHLLQLLRFGVSLRVCLSKEDMHDDYYIADVFFSSAYSEKEKFLRQLMDQQAEMRPIKVYELSEEKVPVIKPLFPEYEKLVSQLYYFIRIFKQDLKGISIEKREEKNYYYCSLNMQYDGYSIAAEFESTGIKKLIRLFPFLKEMVEGEIVFIDEFDSNLHDVYLCALLEYLMQYGKGQLCFTTHNIGPMDILKHNKKSIDFLSVDHKIYSWTSSGNYSPSNLYRSGMIEGSPFNVDSIDFLKAFGTGDN